MSVLEEQRRETAAGALRCSAMVPVEEIMAAVPLIIPGLIPCGLPADGWYQGRCPCGHVRDGWLCGFHGARAGDGGCRACLELADGPHDCPLPVSRVTPGGMP